MRVAEAEESTTLARLGQHEAVTQCVDVRPVWLRQPVAR